MSKTTRKSIVKKRAQFQLNIRLAASYKILITAMLIFSILTLTACQGQGQNPENGGLKEDYRAITDLQGKEIQVPNPENIQKIISLAPSNTEILVSLGLGDKIIAIDSYSKNIQGIGSDLPQLDMMQPDAEAIVALGADVILTTSMSSSAGEDLFKPVKNAGECVVEIPVAESIRQIEESILFIGDATGKSEQSKGIVEALKSEIRNISAVGDAIVDKKSVYFEVGSMPDLYSFGKNVFLNEMIEIIGATNILADQTGWIPISEEAVISANPDVILTNIDYMPEPAKEIKARRGWESVNGVKNNQVYFISTNPSTQPTQNIIIALKEMAKAVYPDKF